VLVVPVALLAVPSIVHRNIPFIIAFMAILVLLILLPGLPRSAQCDLCCPEPKRLLICPAW
jgi:hypothetical protein